MGRFDQLINPPITQADEENYPENLPRNALADAVNPTLSKLTIPFADKLGLMESVQIPKMSKADDIRYMQELPENLASNIGLGTRTVGEMVKKFGPEVGEIIGKEIERNAVGGKVSDLIKRLGLTGEKRSDQLFNPQALDAAKNQFYKSREKLVNTPVDDFLKLAEKLSYPQRDKLDRIREAIKTGKKLDDIPFLQFDIDPATNMANAFGHEGRHRALALKEQGYTHMPVRFNAASEPRWGNQTEKLTSSKLPNMDYVEKWPTKISGESGNTLPFPVSREQAGQPFPRMRLPESERPDLINNPLLQDIIKTNETKKLPIDYSEEYMQNLKRIQDLKKNPENWDRVLDTGGKDVGHYNQVYIPKNGDKVVKKQRVDEFPSDQFIPISDQLIFNDLKHLAPETRAIRTDSGVYQIQDKLQEFGDKQRNYKYHDAVNPKVKEARQVTNERVEPEDLTGNNVGIDPEGNVKFMDVNGFDIMSKFPKESVDQFMKTYRNAPKYDLENAAVLKGLLTPEAYQYYLKKMGQ